MDSRMRGHGPLHSDLIAGVETFSSRRLLPGKGVAREKLTCRHRDQEIKAGREKIRPGEVIGMRSAEIDGRWWTIPSKRAKNDRSHRVYLTDLALGLIGDGQEKDFLFPCPHKDKIKKIEAHALGVAVRRNLAWPITDSKGNPLFDADGKSATENKLGVDQFTQHDLRRTAATFLAEMGTMDEVIDAVLNHAKQGVIKVYNQYRYDKEKQMALEAWERKLNSIIIGAKGKIISISTKKPT
jgi:integrase